MIQNSIRERKATRITHLRDELLWAIDKMVWFRSSYYKRWFRLKHKRIEAVIRPISLLASKRLVFEITLRITEKIRDAAGNIKKVFHNFIIELPIELGVMVVK